MKLDPCYLCGAPMRLFKDSDGEYHVECTKHKPPHYCIFMDCLGHNKGVAVKAYNSVARAPL